MYQSLRISMVFTILYALSPAYFAPCYFHPNIVCLVIRKSLQGGLVIPKTNLCLYFRNNKLSAKEIKLGCFIFSIQWNGRTSPRFFQGLHKKVKISRGSSKITKFSCDFPVVSIKKLKFPGGNGFFPKFSRGCQLFFTKISTLKSLAWPPVWLKKILNSPLRGIKI